MAKNGFSSEEQRKETQKRYENTEKGRQAIKKRNAKYGVKQFIEQYATLEELKELQEKLKIRIKHFESDK